MPLIVTIPGLLGLAVLLNPDGSPLVLVAENDVRANITNHTFNDVLPLLMGKYLGPGPARPGRDGDDRRLHVGHGRQRQRLRHRLDLRRLPAADQPQRQRPPLPDHGPLGLAAGRAASRSARPTALFYFSNILEFLQVLIFFFIVPLFGVVILGMLWKRATPDRRASVGFLTAILALDRHVGLRPHVPRRLPARSRRSCWERRGGHRRERAMPARRRTRSPA